METPTERATELRSVPTHSVEPLWEAVAGRVLLPASATSVRVTRDADAGDPGAIELSFRVGNGRADRDGMVPASLQTSLLRDTMRTIQLASQRLHGAQAPLDVQVELVAPLYPGRIVGRGRVVGRRPTFTLIEATLHDSTGALVAMATASAPSASLSEDRAAA